MYKLQTKKIIKIEKKLKKIPEHKFLRKKILKHKSTIDYFNEGYGGYRRGGYLE